jgi:carboxyl-terminal processing protease
VKRSWLVRTILLLSIGLLACQVTIRVPAWMVPVPTPTATYEARAKWQPAQRKTATPTPTLTPTPLPPTPTPTPSPTAAPTQKIVANVTPLLQSVQFNIFNDLWRTIKEDYLYEDFNGLNWNDIGVEYQQRIEAGLTSDEFYAAMDEVIMRLGDDHSVFLSPAQVSEEDDEFQGKYDYVGIGVMLSAVPDRQRAVIIVTFPDSPAKAAGLQPRDNLLEVNGEPILDEEGYLRDIVRGPAVSEVILTVQTPGQTPHQVTLKRQQITSSLPIPYQILKSPEGKRIGYILLTSFADNGIDEMVGKALKEMAAENKLDGLIIDNTQNGGGADTVLRPTLAYFSKGIVGYFVSRESKRPLDVGDGEDIDGSQNLPLVVLVGLDTVSYGEVFAGVLKDTGRAYIIGETTGGNVETLVGYGFEDGSRAWIAHDSFHPLKHPDQDWEVTGIIPDQTVLAHWDEYTIADDPLVIAALDHFDNP